MRDFKEFRSLIARYVNGKMSRALFILEWCIAQRLAAGEPVKEK